MLAGRINLFLSPCQKSRLFETICSLLAVREICPYLEFFSSFPLVISASLKYIVDLNSIFSAVMYRTDQYIVLVSISVVSVSVVSVSVVSSSVLSASFVSKVLPSNSFIVLLLNADLARLRHMYKHEIMFRLPNSIVIYPNVYLKNCKFTNV